jgi:hypothetical protein
MGPIEGSETSANHYLTPGKYPEEHTQYSEHGESLKSRIFMSFFHPQSHTSTICASVSHGSVAVTKWELLHILRNNNVY